MHHHTLRELAKVGVGLFIADLASILWLGGAGFFPLSILGLSFTSASVLPIAFFDLIVILLLAHYGWRMKFPVRSPGERTLLMVIGAIFLIVGLVHLVRLTFGLPVLLGSFSVPLWVSWAGVVVTGYLAYASFHFARHRG